MAAPTGNEVVRTALATLMELLTKRGHRWTRAELDLIERAEAALGGSNRVMPERGALRLSAPERAVPHHGGGG